MPLLNRHPVFGLLRLTATAGSMLLASAMALISQNAFGQIQPEALDLAKKVSNIYGPVKQYQLSSRSDLGNGSETVSIELAFQEPDKYRLETTITSSGVPRSMAISSLVVFDGVKSGAYTSTSNVYTIGNPDKLPVDVDAGVGIGEFRDLQKTYRDRGGEVLRILREDRISVGGGIHDCSVMELSYPRGQERFWIEKGTYLVLRVEQEDATITYERTELNGSLPPDIFRFTPPKGARPVDPNR